MRSFVTGQVVWGFGLLWCFRTVGPLKIEGLLKVEISMSVSRRKFTQEFKDELCREVISTSKPIKDVAVAYGVGQETLRGLVDQIP